MNLNIRELIESKKTFDVDNLSHKQLLYTLARTQQMFKWDGLPDTIPQRDLELYLQTHGECFITEHDNNLYAYIGSQGGENDEYYRPTLYTIANPYQNFSGSFRVGEEGILARNDSLELGLLPLIRKYAHLLAHSAITMRVALINIRIPSIASASTDSEVTSANKYLSDIESGKLGVVSESNFTDGLKTSPYSQTGSHSLTEAIEADQYLRGCMYNELGLSAQTNPKRANLTEREVSLGDDSLIPLLDDMLACRQKMADEVNAMYGTNITVSLNSVWKHNKDEELACNIDDITEAHEELEDLGNVDHSEDDHPDVDHSEDDSLDHTPHADEETTEEPDNVDDEKEDEKDD